MGCEEEFSLGLQVWGVFDELVAVQQQGVEIFRVFKGYLRHFTIKSEVWMEEDDILVELEIGKL